VLYYQYDYFDIKASAFSPSGGGPMKFLAIVKRCRWCLTALILFGAAMTSQAKWLAIHNDFTMYDTDGNAIQVRSGCLCKFGDTYYWYGCSGGQANQTCYSSTDLLHWTNKGVMVTEPAMSNRMDVLYNDSTKLYVMTIKYQLPSNWCGRAVATSTKPDGPYTHLFDSMVYNQKTGDMSCWKDDDGKAYYLYEWDSVTVSGDNTMSLGFSLLSPDYMSLAKRMQRWKNTDREAPMMMKRRGKYYYLTSLMMGISPTLTQYFTAPGIDGPWTTNLVPFKLPAQTKHDSWSTQCDFVFPFKGTKDTVFMYDGDRWEQTETIHEGGYAWLPITFSPKDSVIINYYQDWEVDPDAGTWRVLDRNRDLALHKPATASSTSGGNVANNVTDSSSWQTYMNTKWTSAAGDPQWIMIDLGAPMSVNRVIIKWDSAYAKSFKIQVATDTTKWTDVFSTTKAGQRCITDESFAAATARYVRMYGTQRGTTGGYSIFEFMVLNDSGAITSTSFKPEKSAVAPKTFLTRKNNTIQYSIPSSTLVKLAIVDARGKVMAVLVDGFKLAGEYEAVLPGALSSGMYIIRLTIGTKMVATMQVKL
jgi:hypothetical protein